MNGYLNPPYAPESNPRITPWYYKPSRFPITAISNGSTTTITMSSTDIGGVTVNPNYVVGQEVRIHVPFGYRMYQINRQTATVIAIPSEFEVIVAIDSSLYNPFSYPSYTTQSLPQIAAIGDVNTGQINSYGRINQRTYIPGSFRQKHRNNYDD